MKKTVLIGTTCLLLIATNAQIDQHPFNLEPANSFAMIVSFLFLTSSYFFYLSQTKNLNYA